jgi:hypothetical protein
MTGPIFSAILALAMISFAGWSIASKYSPRQVAPPPIEAPTHPYDNDVAGAGVAERASRCFRSTRATMRRLSRKRRLRSQPKKQLSHRSHRA